MSRGGRIRRVEPTTTTNLSGLWTLNEIGDYISETKWPRGPIAPTGLTTTSGNGQLSLTWTAPTTTHGTITNYLVEYTPSGGSAVTVLTGSTSTSYTLTGLTNNTSHSVRVAAVNFTAGDWSTTASGTPAALSLFSIEYLVVGGGGGAGGNFSRLWGGGGGAGGYRTGTVTSHSLLTATNVSVGSGGPGGLDHIEVDEDGGVVGQGLTYATNGSNSSLGSIVSLGGGAGANSYVRFGLYPLNNASSGGSGGGGGGTTHQGYMSNGGTGTAGQGFAGSFGSNYNIVGGGGGAGGAGSSGGDLAIGGPGVSNSITGLSVVYASGGASTDAAPASAQNENTGNGGTTRSGEVRGADSSKRGKKGVVVLAYPSSNPALTSIGAGLTYTVSTSSRTGYRVYIFTNGSGDIQMA